MNKENFLSELEFVKNTKAIIEITDEDGNFYSIEDFGTDKDETVISIFIKKK